jgi:hypothetical protein
MVDDSSSFEISYFVIQYLIGISLFIFPLKFLLFEEGEASPLFIFM